MDSQEESLQNERLDHKSIIVKITFAILALGPSQGPSCTVCMRDMNESCTLEKFFYRKKGKRPIACAHYFLCRCPTRHDQTQTKSITCVRGIKKRRKKVQEVARTNET